MPYSHLKDLPTSVQHVLPRHAQEIYRAAFNSAFEEYKNPKKRRDPKEDSEKVAHKIAWAAVKKEYKKTNGKWTRKS